MRRAARVLSCVPLLAIIGWGTLALIFRLSMAPSLAMAIAGLYATGALAVLIWLRPFWRAVVVNGVAFLAIVLWWSTIRPSNDREWAADVARIPTGEVHGDLLTLHNVRNFDYRSETDFTPHYEDRTYDLAKLRGLDLFLSYWGSPAIAHTIMSWDFEDAPPLAISIETRKEKAEAYSAIRGFFKEYELCYVAADERDLVRLRTNYRGEHVYLYALNTTPEFARALLLDYVVSMNQLAAQPEFYNALTQNCTTAIRAHTLHLGQGMPWDWRLLANGYGDELLYETGRINTSLPFATLKQRSLIDNEAKAADQDPGFSRRIRSLLPPGR